MRKKKTLQSLSTSTETNGALPKDSMQPTPVLPTVKLYTDLELPLKSFITCVTTGNLTPIIISGAPSVATLVEAWESIMYQYADIIGTSEHKLYTSVKQSYEDLVADFNIVANFIPVLQRFYVKEFAKAINKALRTNFKFDWHNGRLYYKELEKSAKMLKGLKLRIDMKASELESMKESGSTDSSKPVTKNHFQAVLINLSDHAKYRIDDSITTFEYCKRIHNYTEQIRSWQQKKK